MGVDYGGDRRDKSPPEFGAGDANANCPPEILSYRYKNERSVAFKIRQNPFSAGALPRTPLGLLKTLPRPLSRLESGHPSPYLTPLGTDPPWALAMRPPRSPARSTPMPLTFRSLPSQELFVAEAVVCINPMHKTFRANFVFF